MWMVDAVDDMLCIIIRLISSMHNTLYIYFCTEYDIDRWHLILRVCSCLSASERGTELRLHGHSASLHGLSY